MILFLIISKKIRYWNKFLINIKAYKKKNIKLKLYYLFLTVWYIFIYINYLLF